MSMVVRTNAMAINANNALNKNNSTVSKNLEKLSTGLKINRAADDASGLAISKKMDAKIKLLDTAKTNAQDGVSLLQTAEGYMGEVHDMLNRIAELAEKSANGTYETKSMDEKGIDGEGFGSAETDRQALQDEVDQLCSEIDRIASTANFNNLKLMDGTLAEKSQYTYDDIKSASGVYVLKSTATSQKGNAGSGAAISGFTKTGEYKTYADGVTVDEDLYLASDFEEIKATGAKIDGETTATTWTSTDSTAQAKYGNQRLVDYINNIDGPVLSVTSAPSGPDMSANVLKASTKGGGLKLQIGETSTTSDKLTVNVRSFKTEDLFKSIENYKNDDGTGAAAGVDKAILHANAKSKNASGKTINISNQDTASLAAEALRKTIDEVSAQRAQLGAQENRLDYTMNNLTTASENTTNAKSRITDTDMAKTMMQYTQGNVLTQAAQAMLAQANQSTQSVLQLLQ